MTYLSDQQLEELGAQIAKEVALTDTVSGERFEDLLGDVLPESQVIQQKVWFDIKQNDRGIEAKTFKNNNDTISPGTRVRNVLKRVPPDILPEELTVEQSNDKQVDTNSNPERVGEEVINYLYSLMNNHASRVGITGDYDFAVLLRSNDQTQVGYWEETIDFGEAEDYNWYWVDSGLKGELDGEEMFTWYCVNQRQLFYKFVAPEDVQILDIEDVDVKLLTSSEISELLDEAYQTGYEAGEEGIDKKDELEAIYREDVEEKKQQDLDDF